MIATSPWSLATPFFRAMKDMKKYTSPPWFFLALMVLVSLPSIALAGRNVRVLVLEGKKRITIDRGQGSEPLVIKRAGGGESALVNGRPRGLPMEFRAPRRGFIRLNGRPYRGVIRVYADERGGLMVVDDLDIEEYVAGIINYEISSAWPIEAVKAQAVAARTYVLYRMEHAPSWPYDIEGTTAGQVYRGAASEDPLAREAVNSCRGEVLLYGGHPALTVYHSNAGGRTDAAEDIWRGQDHYPYLRSVASPYDRASPHFRWDFAVPAAIFGRVLRAEGLRIGLPVEVVVEDLTPGGRVRSLRVSDDRGRTISLRGEEIRKIIGYSILRSTLFKVRRDGDFFIFFGRGSGHGVGMSQWGARGMAEAGYSYREILGHYYPWTRLKKVF